MLLLFVCDPEGESKSFSRCHCNIILTVHRVRYMLDPGLRLHTPWIQTRPSRVKDRMGPSLGPDIADFDKLYGSGTGG